MAIIFLLIFMLIINKPATPIHSIANTRNKEKVLLAKN